MDIAKIFYANRPHISTTLRQHPNHRCELIIILMRRLQQITSSKKYSSCDVCNKSFLDENSTRMIVFLQDLRLLFYHNDQEVKSCRISVVICDVAGQRGCGGCNKAIPLTAYSGDARL